MSPELNVKFNPKSSSPADLHTVSYGTRVRQICVTLTLDQSWRHYTLLYSTVHRLRYSLLAKTRALDDNARGDPGPGEEAFKRADTDDLTYRRDVRHVTF